MESSFEFLICIEQCNDNLGFIEIEHSLHRTILQFLMLFRIMQMVVFILTGLANLCSYLNDSVYCD